MKNLLEIFLIICGKCVISYLLFLKVSFYSEVSIFNLQLPFVHSQTRVWTKVNITMLSIYQNPLPPALQLVKQSFEHPSSTVHSKSIFPDKLCCSNIMSDICCVRWYRWTQSHENENLTFLLGYRELITKTAKTRGNVPYKIHKHKEFLPVKFPLGLDLLAFILRNLAKTSLLNLCLM